MLADGCNVWANVAVGGASNKNKEVRIDMVRKSRQIYVCFSYFLYFVVFNKEKKEKKKKAAKKSLKTGKKNIFFRENEKT